MKIRKAYIISYISPKWNDAMKEKRIALHRKQIDWVKKQGLTPYVFAQYEGSCDVNYLPWDGRKYLPGDARNECLKHFYATDDDFALFLDDDAMLDGGKLENDTFISTLASMDVSGFNKCSFVSPINPRFDAYNEFHETHSSVLSENLVMKSKPHQAGFIFFLKNIKKHHGREIYYEENWCEPNGTVKYGEDAVFSMKMVEAGFGSYQCWNISALDMGKGVSTHTQDAAIEKTRMIKVKFDIQQIFPDLEIKTLPDGRSFVQWAKWSDKHQLGRYIYIPKISNNNPFFTP